jgi:hypothetical protein
VTSRPVGDHVHSQHSNHEPAPHVGGLNSMAAGATLHCLTGCAIGEIIGLIIGTAAGLGNVPTIAISVALAFVFGFLLSSLPLLRAGLTVAATSSVVVAADTLSIATMEVVDNVVMAVIPGAMDAGLVNALFWVGMMISLTMAFFAAYPVNRYLLQRGRGHALTHDYHHGAVTPAGARRFLPSIPTPTLVAVVVSIADDLGSPGNAPGHSRST